MRILFTLRQQCSRLPTAQWPTFASTAAWRRLRCCGFFSTSSKLKTARMTLPSTSCTQVEVSECRSLPCSSSLADFVLHAGSSVCCDAPMSTAERVKLKRSDHPLVLRVIQGPCEQVCKVFLMEEDLGEEVTYDVNLLTLFVFLPSGSVINSSVINE